MTLNTQRFAKKYFEVEAVRITNENFEDVRAWCNGIEQPIGEFGRYFKVEVKRAVSERQTRAHIGDWILWAGNGYKVYTNNAFRQFFEPVRHVEIVNTPRRPDVFPGEPEVMQETLPFSMPNKPVEMQEVVYGKPPEGFVDNSVAMLVEKPKPRPRPMRPLTVIRTAKNTEMPVGFTSNPKD
jgi:hypothetical protein